MTSAAHDEAILAFDPLQEDAIFVCQTARFGELASLDLAISCLQQVEREFPPVSVDAERSGNFANECAVMDDAGMKIF